MKSLGDGFFFGMVATLVLLGFFLAMEGVSQACAWCSAWIRKQFRG